MSSPLSSLGKHRRVPLQSPGKRTVPFKLSAYNEDEAALLNDILSPRTKFPVQDISPSCSKGTATKTSTHGAAPTDMELMSSMMQKIALLEQKAKSQAQEIQLKARKVAELEKQVKILQKGKDSPKSSGIEELEVKCLQLQNQVWEMERFLNDYGLIWVGERNEQLEELKSLKKQENLPSRGLWKPGHSTVSNYPIDFDLIFENLKDLNVLAGEGVSQIERTAGGARLRQPQSISLTFYQNGIVMFNGPFRSYEEPSTQQCLQDIMDGYFPSELQTRYPDGVPFQLCSPTIVALPSFSMLSVLAPSSVKATEDNHFLPFFGCRERNSTSSAATLLSYVSRPFSRITRAGAIAMELDQISAAVLTIVNTSHIIHQYVQYLQNRARKQRQRDYGSDEDMDTDVPRSTACGNWKIMVVLGQVHAMEC
ncbi:UBX domain-containing protein 11 isoform X3 [Lepidochelys kempii]|uniref:UBX domain-containing protein 11 isoform X3 n=1 Tax=Lepidochelys kempii TaxID=8472 RepID=UPI003C6F5782